ncbi:MAG: DUF4325 domain-containing protein [Idiomarina sp.]|nr:MAG: DUF4325 domain-containing protein [Idiomarina sp.]
MKKQQLKIKIVEAFHPRPKWRYRKEGEGSGQAFREEHLIPAFEAYENVEVDLTGYNRYGPSFISEAFGGLIREGNMRLSEIQRRLTIKHDLLPSVISMAWQELRDAEDECNGS